MFSSQDETVATVSSSLISSGRDKHSTCRSLFPCFSLSHGPVSLSVKGASSLRHLLNLIQSTTPNLWAHKAVPGSWPITADRAVATKNLPQTEECRGLSPPLPPLSFSKPGCLACKQLPMLVWHLLCQHAWEKLIKRLALPLPHLPFSPQSKLCREVLTHHTCAICKTRDRMFSFSCFSHVVVIHQISLVFAALSYL